MFRVTMSFAGQPVRKFTFDKREIAIGRDAACDIVVENIGASRRHATIERTGEGYVLTDLRSHNGTFVDGQKILHHRLRESDEFCIGKYSFQFESLEPVTQPARPAAELPAVGGDMTFRLERKDIEKVIGHSVRGGHPQLVQLAPERDRRTIVLDKAYHVLGTHETAEIRLHGLFAPRRAGVVVRGDHGYRALGISRRFKVNGRRVADVPLADGDLVQVGRRRFRFCQA